MNTQECSTDGCVRPAAFTTRTKPAWCVGCLETVLGVGGLKPAEPFKDPTAWWLTTCLICGVQAHYRLVYIVDNNAKGKKTCQACHGKSSPRGLLAEGSEQFELPRGWSRQQIQAAVEENGYELVAMTAEITRDPGHHSMIVSCKSCQRISVEGLGGIGWGCSCSRNQNRSSFEGRAAKPALLKDSDSRALKWWDHQLNTTSDFNTATVNATRTCHWLCPECGLRFAEKVSTMTRWLECPACRVRQREEWKRETARWEVTPIPDVPELLSAWADDADPQRVMVSDGLRVWRFKCPAGHNLHVRPLLLLESGCPHCRGAKTRARPDKTWLADVDPELSSQWHPTLNGKWNPSNVVPDSKRPVWWRADCCGYEWEEQVRNRNKYQRWRCPNCRTILDSIAWHDPGLAAEWSPTNPRSAWEVRPHATTPFVPDWICATNPHHVWRAPLTSRSNGAECPECRETGKSRVELDHHAAAVEVFGNARSGVAMRHKAFTTRKAWTTDISVDSNGTTLVIEYDGVYWHSAAAKVLVDERKSLDLLAAGCVVVRLREDSLPPLPVHNPRYREIQVYSTASRPRAVMVEIREWVAGVARLPDDTIQ
jgi:hypothetical protein